MKAARVELSEMVTELSAVTNSRTELWNVMQAEVAAAAAYFDLTGPQRSLLWAEIQLQISDHTDRKGGPKGESIDSQAPVANGSPTEQDAAASEGGDSTSHVLAHGPRRPTQPTPEQVVTAEKMVAERQQVTTRIAANWLPCSVQHMRRLARAGDVTASKTRPMYITTDSLRAYKWGQKKAGKSEDRI